MQSFKITDAGKVAFIVVTAGNERQAKSIAKRYFGMKFPRAEVVDPYSIPLGEWVKANIERVANKRIIRKDKSHEML